MAYFGQERRSYQNAWLRERRQEALDRLGSKCVVCGTTDDLEFHHKDPSAKEVSVNAILSRRRSIFDRELAKCELRCRAHHKAVHAHQRQHGTRPMYRSGCRCDLCKEFMTGHRREFRARHLENIRFKNREYMRRYSAARRAATQTEKRSGSNPDGLSVQI